MLNASLGAAKSGYLSTDQLRQLCIYKGLYSTTDGAPSQLKMVNWLMGPDVFSQEKKAV